MKRRRAVIVGFLCTVFSVGFVSLGMAGMRKEAPVVQYDGHVRSVRIDKCGQEPGTCEGGIVLMQKLGAEVALAIKPGTWLRRGDKFVLIDHLKVGEHIQARALENPGDPTPRLTEIDLLGSE